MLAENTVRGFCLDKRPHPDFEYAVCCEHWTSCKNRFVWSLTLTRQRALSIANLSIYHLALKLDTYLHGIHLFIFTSIWKTTSLQVVRFHISNFVKSDFCSIHEQAVNMTSSFLGSLFPNNSCLSIFILVPVELNISPATPGTEHHLDCFALAGCFCFFGSIQLSDYSCK